MNSWSCLARDEQTTRRLGLALAAALRPGMVVALDGPLGAGKTRLVQAVAAGLDVVGQEVASPTFVLVRQYHGRLELAHLDLYRVRDADELWELGLDELLTPTNLALIEWAGRFPECLPGEHLRVEIRVLGETERCFEFTPVGAAAERVVAEMRQALAAGGE